MTVTDTRDEVEIPEPETPAANASPAPGPVQHSPIERLLSSTDHKSTGLLLLLGSLLFLLVALVGSLLTNADLAGRSAINAAGILNLDAATILQLNTPLLLVFGGLVPLMLGLATVVVPLQVGSPNVAFPRLAAASAWTWLLSTVLFVVSALSNGSYGGGNTKVARLGNVAFGAMLLALALGTICVAVTVLSNRPEGMTLARTPAFSFSMLVAAAVWVPTFASALARVVLLHIQRPNAATLAAGWAEIGWLLRQPSMYLVAIPVLGIVADVVPVMARAPQRLVGVVQGSIGVFGLFAFGAWAQGADPTSPPARQTLVWVAWSLVAVLPVLALVGGLADTLRRGRPRLAAPALFALGGVLVLLLATVFGALLGLNTAGSGDLIDLLDLMPAAGAGTGLMLLVAGAALIVGVGALFYWGPKLFGGELPARAGLGVAALAALGVLLWALPHVVLGLINPSGNGYRAFAGVSAAGAALALLALLGAVAGVAAAIRYSGAGPRDPWGGFTLEWATASPPPDGNFDEVPVVASATPLYRGEDEAEESN